MAPFGEMSLGRKLLPIAGPLGIAGVLAVITSLDESAPPDEPQPVYTEHARTPPPPPERIPMPPAPKPVAPPLDRPRCLASMTARELGRGMMALSQVEAIATLYREEATPALAGEYLQGLADAGAALPGGVPRSQLLVIAAHGLLRLGRAVEARAALEASRDLPPPAHNEFGFERSDWYGEAAAMAARLDDHALARTLVAEDRNARAALACHYAETRDIGRAGALIEREPEDSDLAWRLDIACARTGVGAVRGALTLAKRIKNEAPLIRLEIARVLIEQEHDGLAIAVLRDAIDGLDEIEKPGHRLGTLVALARAFDDAGDPDAALESFDRARSELRALGDFFQTLGPWSSLIDAEHQAGRTAQAWEDLEALEAVGLADMLAAPLVRVMLLAREHRLDEALTMIHDTAGMPYPLAYAQIHARMREPDPALEARLDDSLRMFCPDG